MTNKIAVLAAAACVLVLGACNARIDIGFDNEGVDGSGVITTEIYQLSGINKIKVCCSLDVEVEVTGDGSGTVEVQTDDNLHSRMEIKVSNDGTLSIEPETRSLNLRSTGPIVVRISDPLIVSIEASAASTLSGTFPEVRAMSVRANSASRINASIEADEVDLEATSASDVTLTGRADQLSVATNSAANADLSELQAIDTEIDVTSASNVKIYTTNSITGEATSAASVEVRGGPSTAQVDTSSGAGVDYLP